MKNAKLMLKQYIMQCWSHWVSLRVFFVIIEIDVIGELLVISGLLVKEMKKTDNQQLMAQEVYNFELNKLQSEKAAKVKANLGQRNRFQELLREKVDKNPLSAAPNQV